MGHTEKMLPFSKLFSGHEREDWLLNSVLKLFGIQRPFNFGGRVGRRERQKAEDSLGVLMEMSWKQSSICVSFPPSMVTYRQKSWKWVGLFREKGFRGRRGEEMSENKGGAITRTHYMHV